MSVYAVNKLCRRVVHEPELRAALLKDPEPVLVSADPALSDDEIRALLDGDVGTLSHHGANSFLLHQLGRWGMFGLDLPRYADRIRTAYVSERES